MHPGQVRGYGEMTGRLAVMGKVGWVLVLVSLLLGPLLAIPGMVLAGLSARGGGDWQPTVALGTMVCLAWLSLATLGLAMG